MIVRKLIGTEAVRINGQWRTVEVYADTLGLAVHMGHKAARSKTLKSKVVFGGVMVKVLPVVSI
jgi:hypothetical protein